MISIIGEFRGEKNIFKTCKVLAIPTGPLLEHCCFLVAESWPTLCHLMDCSTPGFPVLHYLPEFVQTHVHWVGDAIQLSHPLSPTFPLTFNLSQHQGLFKWVSSLHQSQIIGVSASTSVLPMNAQDWPPLGWTGWISLQFQGLSRVVSNTTVQKHQFLSAQEDYLYLTLTWNLFTALV